MKKHGKILQIPAWQLEKAKLLTFTPGVETSGEIPRG